MIIDGNWDAATLEKAMGANVAPILPPFTAKPSRESCSSRRWLLGLEVLAASDAGGGVLEVPADAAGGTDHQGGGLIPDTKGATAANPSTTRCWPSPRARYAVPDDRQRDPGQRRHRGQNQLDAALGGDSSALAALKNMQATLQSLPAAQRSSTYSQ